MQIRWFAGAADAVGCEEETVDAASLAPGSVQDALVALHPQAADVIARCTFLADGRGVRRDDDFREGWETLDVLPPFAGG